MKINILGTRGQIPLEHPNHKKQSGVLINEELLLDLGEKEFLDYNPNYILLTHLHPDHAYFLKTKEILNHKNIYVPEENKYLPAAKIIRSSMLLGDYKIIPIPVLHSVHAKSFGYIVQYKNKKLFYSGDLVSVEEKYHNELHDLDVVITEGSFLRNKGVVRKDNKTGRSFGHTGIPQIINLFKPFTRHIILMHFGSWFMKDVEKAHQKLKELETKKLKITPAHDGQQFYL